MEVIEINFKNTCIKFTLIRKNVKNINLRIKSNGNITVSANKKVPLSYIIDFISNKGEWILESKRRLEERNRRSKCIDSNSFIYLGKSYNIKYIKNNFFNIQLKNNYAYIYVDNSSCEEKKNSLIEEWYLKNCRSIFMEVYREIFKRFNFYKIPEVSIAIRKMKTRWGSCNPLKKKVNLNSELIKYDIKCIEFVIAHELTHLIHANHSKNFYLVLDSIMPDWRIRKQILDENKYPI